MTMKATVTFRIDGYTVYAGQLRGDTDPAVLRFPGNFTTASSSDNGDITIGGGGGSGVDQAARDSAAAAQAAATSNATSIASILLGSTTDADSFAELVGKLTALALTSDGKYIPYNTVTGVKTAAYTAAAGELVRADISSGSFPLTLPSASSKWDILVKVVGATSDTNPTTVLTVTAAGTDIINAAGTTTVPMRYRNQLKRFSSAGNGVVIVSGGDFDLSVGDNRADARNARNAPGGRRTSGWQASGVPVTKWPGDGTRIQSRGRMRLVRSKVGGRNVEIKFGTLFGPGEQLPNGDGSPITYQASIEYPAGKLHPAFSRDGAASISVTPGAVGTLVVPGFEVPIDADWWVRYYATVPSTGGLLACAPSDGVTEWVSTSASETNPTRTTANDLGANNNYSSGPTAVTYEPYATVPCVAIIGTSIDVGKGDPNGTDTSFYSTAQGGGWAERAISADGQTGRPLPSGIAAMMLAISAETFANMADTTKSHLRRQMIDDARASSFFLGGPVNDLGSNTSTVAVSQTAWLTTATACTARGGRVFGFTAPPAGVTTTDGWITTANQTLAVNEPSRRLFNQWARAGAPIDPTTKAAVAVGTAGALIAGQTGHPFFAIIDTGSLIETTLDSGVIKPATRTITDAVTTVGSANLNSNSANFTAADVGETVSIVGAAASGAVLTASIVSVTSATTAVLDRTASLAVGTATAGIGLFTFDGIHPSKRGHKAMAAVAAAQAVPNVV